MKGYRVLVITAECGEPQFNILVKLLKQQTLITYEHRVISNKTALQAETFIYEESRNASDFDWIIRIDADMLPLYNDSIIQMVKEAQKLKVDRLSYPLTDFYTGKQIQAIHLFKPQSKDGEYELTEFKPESWIGRISGKTEFKLNRTLFSHGFNSSDDQCIRFGLHRGLKALNAGPGGRHWFTMIDIRNNMINNRYKREFKLVYLSSIVGAGGFSKVTPQWEMVDKNSVQNAQAKRYIFANLESNRLFKFSLLFMLFLHYNSFKSWKESFKLIKKLFYRKYFPGRIDQKIR